MLQEDFRPVIRQISVDVRGLPQADMKPAFGPSATLDSARPGHPALTIAIHWMTVVAIVVAVAVMFVRDATEDRVLRQVLLEMHRQLGLLVLLGAGVRVTHRVLKGLADHAPDMAASLRWAAKAAHVIMYGVLIALPLLGWAVTSAHGVALTFLGSVPLPKLLPADSELADTLTDYHVWLAWGLLALVVAHVAAAVWHHFGRRDWVLRAMLPSVAGVRGGKRRPTEAGLPTTRPGNA
jgi:cytochrome b561